MNIEQIAEIVLTPGSRITYLTQITKVELTNDTLFGYFEDNHLSSDMYNNNKWKFIISPSKEEMILDGENIKSISIISS